MSEEYRGKRRQIRLTMFLAMCFLIGGANLAMIYGVVYLVNLYVIGNVALAVASGVGAGVVACLLIVFFGIIYKRLKKKLVAVEAQLPVEVDKQ